MATIPKLIHTLLLQVLTKHTYIEPIYIPTYIHTHLHTSSSTYYVKFNKYTYIQAHRTGGVTGSEGQQGANGVGGGNGDFNGDVNGDGAGTGTGVEVNEGAQDGDGSGDGAGTGVGNRRRTPDGNGDGDGSEDSSGDGNGDEDNGNEDRIGEGGRDAKNRKKPQNSCRCHVVNGGDTGGKRKKCRKERVGSAAANPDNLESNKEAGGGCTKYPGFK